MEEEKVTKIPMSETSSRKIRERREEKQKIS
jgi:hypothetical protein